jgi:Uma2 family endonuclease
MASPVTEKKKYTYEDYLKTPDDKSYELIEGALLMTPSPVPKHQRISKKIAVRLEQFVTEKNLGEVFYAPCDVHLDDENVLQPDILFIAKERLDIIGDKNIQGAPDLVIEIISESSAYRDMVQKKKLYARFRVGEYWIVIPEEASIEIFILKDTTYLRYKNYTGDDVLDSPLIKGLTIPLREIF